MSLKLISINIEGQRHLERVLPFLQRERADVVCVQELYGVDVSRFEAALGMTATFVPLVRMVAENAYGFPKLGLFGIGMFVRTDLAVSDVRVDFYRGSPNELAVFGPPNSLARALLSVVVTKEGRRFPVATTHFTWSPGGQMTDEQLRDVQKLITVVEEFDSLFITGDFNAPRGGEVYHELLAAGWQDKVPADVTTTLDPVLHYAGKLDLVVDYFFAFGTGASETTCSTRIVSGVSDHQALVGEWE